MVSSASRKKVTAVLSETRVVELTGLILSLSAEELSLLETKIVKTLRDKSSDCLRKLLATVRLITLLRAARDVFSRGPNDQLGRQVNKVRRRLMAESQRGEGYG